jgi:hypothetical protein
MIVDKEIGCEADYERHRHILSQGRSVLITISELALISNGSGYGWYASEGLIAAK